MDKCQQERVNHAPIAVYEELMIDSAFAESQRLLTEFILSSFGIPAHLLKGESYSGLHATEKQFNERR